MVLQYCTQGRIREEVTWQSRPPLNEFLIEIYFFIKKKIRIVKVCVFQNLSPHSLDDLQIHP